MKPKLNKFGIMIGKYEQNKECYGLRDMNFVGGVALPNFSRSNKIWMNFKIISFIETLI